MTLRYKLDIPDLSADLEKCNLVFTYGTLKMGRGNARLLISHEAPYKGSGVTVDKYAMGDVGCPYVFSRATTEALGGLEEEYYAPVRGDLWEIPHTECFLTLDMLEGHPNHYTRVITEVVDSFGGIVEAWMYEQKDPDSLYHCHVVDLNSEGEYEW